MQLSINARLEYQYDELTDIMMQIELADIPEQTIVSSHIDLSAHENFARVAGEANIGERIWLRTQGLLAVDYQAKVEVNRRATDWQAMDILAPSVLPGDAVAYLLDSLYCQGSRFRNFTKDNFDHLSGGDKIIAMRDWIYRNIAYTPQSSGPDTTALDSFVQRRGVCRDFAHIMVAFARAASIPARVASVYAPDVKPQDFHAVAEVYMGEEGKGGAWHIIDATKMARATEMAIIGVGRDAGDIAFLTSYGKCDFVSQSVCAKSVTGI